MSTIVKRSLAQHEEIIESGVKSFIDIGRSLMSIRDEELYRKATGDKYDTFESYCSKRWGFSRSRAYQLIESAVVVSDLSTNGGQNGTQIPENERQARVLAESAPDAKTRGVIWKTAVESAPKGEDGKPVVTAAIVEKAAASLGIKKPPKRRKSRPSNNGAVPPPPPLPIPEREPGDEAPDPAHAAPEAEAIGKINSKLDFDDKIIDGLFGKLIKAVDNRARALKQMHSAYHLTCVHNLDAFLKAFHEWKVTRR